MQVPFRDKYNYIHTNCRDVVAPKDSIVGRVAKSTLIRLLDRNWIVGSFELIKGPNEVPQSLAMLVLGNHDEVGGLHLGCIALQTPESWIEPTSCWIGRA